MDAPTLTAPRSYCASGSAPRAPDGRLLILSRQAILWSWGPCNGNYRAYAKSPPASIALIPKATVLAPGLKRV